MYDYFLGKELFVDDGVVDVRNKKTSPTGSIPTPPELASYVVENVLGLEDIVKEEDLLACKIIEMILQELIQFNACQRVVA